MHQTYNAQHNGEGVQLPKYGQQLLDIHQNAIPGVTRPEEGEISVSVDGRDNRQPSNMTYEDMERQRARERYEEYLDEQDSDKLPNAFDLGAKRNLLHLFGHSPLLWPLPIINTTGDGWSWEASPKWIQARERLSQERDEQRQREQAAGWGTETPVFVQNTTYTPDDLGVTRQYLAPSPALSAGRRTPSKADRVLGRDPNLYADEPPTSLPMRKLSPYGAEVEDDYDTSSDEDAAKEQRAMNVVTNGAWARSGASGLLRKPTNSRLSPTSQSAHHDDEVD